jgi:small-conductance mechanosensitive channel
MFLSFTRVLAAAIILSAIYLLLSTSGAVAQGLNAAEAARVDAARQTLREVEAALPRRAEDFAGMLELRQQVEPRRNDLRELAAAVQGRVVAAQARLREFGPAPAAGAPEERPEIAADRRRFTALVAETEAGLRAARVVLAQAEQAWDDLTDRRRKLFTSRIFEPYLSILSPTLWTGALGEAIPQVARRSGRKFDEISSEIAARGGWPILLGLAGFMALVTGLLVALHRWLARRRRENAPEESEAPTKGAIVARAGLILLMRALPFAVFAFALGYAVTRLGIVPDDVQVFLVGLSGALFVYGLGAGAARAVFSPGNPAYRVIAADDATARRAVRVMSALLMIFLSSLILHGLEQMLSVLTVLTVFTTALTTFAMVVVAGVMLAGGRGEAAPVSGFVNAPLHLLRPILWGVGILALAALALGYISFASFIVGRALATAVILCVAILAYIAIETIFHDAIEPGTAANARISKTLGIGPETVDLVGTIVAGILRVATVIVTVLVLFSPWGVEFGNTNPFDDALFGVRFGDVRNLLGAAGIAIVLFAVGLVGTRLFVAWLDTRLLPRTTLDTGMRHSISTIAGYVGFAIALAIALGQAGVELQNIALVAGALSVGIGFGLQQVVSNFVAGLIVLAERPIRVGDIVVVKGEEGKVKKISVRSTELSLGERSTLIVPNADFISSIVKNRSLTDPTQRVKVVMLLAHDTDMPTAFRILLDAANGQPNVLKTSAPSVHITKVTDVGVELELKFIADHLDNMDIARTQVIYTTLVRFKEHGIRLATA